MSEKCGRVPAAASRSNSAEGHEVGGEAVAQPRHVDHPGEGDRVGLEHVDLPGLAVLLEPVEDRLGVVVVHEVAHGPIDHESRRRRGGPERAVGHGLRRDLAEPVVEHAEPAGDLREHGHLLWGVAGHDLRVLVVGRLAAHLGREEADVVGDEAVHGGGLAGRRRVERRHHLGRVLETVGLVEHVEQLGVRVLVLLARVGVRRVHPGRHAVGDHLALGTVLRPLGDRVAQVLADHALEGREPRPAGRGGPAGCRTSGSRRGPGPRGPWRSPVLVASHLPRGPRRARERPVQLRRSSRPARGKLTRSRLTA